MEAATIVEAEFRTEFAKESLRGVAVVRLDEDDGGVSLRKFLEGGGLAAACKPKRKK